MKVSLLFTKFTNLRENNSRMLRIKKVKFYMNPDIWEDFQTFISVALIPWNATDIKDRVKIRSNKF